MSVDAPYVVQTSDISDEECLVAAKDMESIKEGNLLDLHDEFVSVNKKKSCSNEDRFKPPRSASDMTELSKLQ